MGFLADNFTQPVPPPRRAALLAQIAQEWRTTGVHLSIDEMVLAICMLAEQATAPATAAVSPAPKPAAAPAPASVAPAGGAAPAPPST